MDATKWHDELEQAAAESADARDRFLATIFAAKKAGMTIRQIAASAGVSHQRIHQILHDR